MVLWSRLFFTGIACAAIIPQHVIDSTRYCLPQADAEPENSTLHAEAVQDPNFPVPLYDQSSQSWTGYLSLQSGRNLFFWMQQSKRSVANDPIVLWLNGGPGCSSLHGLLTQWGSEIFSGKGPLDSNPAILNEKATMIYLEQPIGVGFSYGANPADRVRTSQEAAQDVFDFLVKFRATAFNGQAFAIQDLHIAGESFAGHYIPAIAQRILAAPAATQAALKLKSIAIGNGVIDQIVQQRAIYDMICNPELAPRKEWMLTSDQCTTWNKKLVLCIDTITRCRAREGGLEYCKYIHPSCRQASTGKYWKIKERDSFDLSRKRPFQPNLPIGAPRTPIEAQLAPWLNTITVRTSVGATNPSSKWEHCSHPIKDDFVLAGDWSDNSRAGLEQVLQTTDIRVLLYAGDTDLVANFLGVKQVARAILWPGIDGFNVLANRPEASYEKLIDAENKVYGNYINFDRLMYARVFDAGHVINQNRPKESKNLLERWLAGENFGKSGREVVGKEEDL